MPAAAAISETAPRRRIDWDEIALVLGRGAPVTQVAELYRCSRVTIWKKMRSDDRFRRLVAEEQARARAESAAHMEMLREKTARKLEQLLDQGNVRVVLWLAKQLGLVAADYSGLLARVADQPSVLETATTNEKVRNYVAPATRANWRISATFRRIGRPFPSPTRTGAAGCRLLPPQPA